MSATFNMFDLIFAIGSFIFILVAFFRGFVKELFSLINWIITISLSYLLTPYAAKFVAYYSHNKLVINVASGSIVFITIFILTTLATRGLAHDWKEKMPVNLDRVLGIFYGVFKSLLIFGLFYSVTMNFYSILVGNTEKTEIAESKEDREVEKDHEAKKQHKSNKRQEDLPDWIIQAKCYQIVKFAGEVIDPLVSKAIDSTATNLLDDMKPAAADLNDIIDDSESGVGDEVEGGAAALSEKKSGEKSSDTGYSKKEIEKMNRLIEIVN